MSPSHIRDSSGDDNILTAYMDYDTDMVSAPQDLDADRGDVDCNEYITGPAENAKEREMHYRTKKISSLKVHKSFSGLKMNKNDGKNLDHDDEDGILAPIKIAKYPKEVTKN